MPKLTAKKQGGFWQRPAKGRKAKKTRWTPAVLTAHLRRTAIGAGAVGAVVAIAIVIMTDLPGRAWQATADAGWGLTEQAGLRVEELVVYGLSRTSAADARAALAIDRGTPILQVDVRGAHERLTSLPWIASARIRRQLPDRVLVEIVERTPLAIWRDGRRIGIIDTAGVLIMPVVPGGLEHLPVITGHEANDAAPDFLAALKQRPDVGARIVASRRIAGRRWDVQLDTGVVVRLPNDDLAHAFDRLKQHIDDGTIANEAVVAIDLRQDDRLIYKLTPEALALLAELKESS